MKIARKEFQHPCGSFAKGFLWWGNEENKSEEKKWIAQSMSEVRQQVADFVNALGPSRLVNICEYTSMKALLGDDKLTHFVVWYWEEVPVVEPTDVGPVS